LSEVADENEKNTKLVDLLFETPGDIGWDDDYVDFVDKLSKHSAEAEMKKFVGSGEKDNNFKDDVFKTSFKTVNVSDLIPTQNEIDINKSLAWPLVKNPDDFVKYNKGDGPIRSGQIQSLFLMTSTLWTDIIDGHNSMPSIVMPRLRSRILTNLN